jgi:four helix bundle protein
LRMLCNDDRRQTADGRSIMGVQRMYKFESLEVWELSLEYVDMIYRIAAQLPETERYNLISQVIRAGTSIALNIAEGSTGQSDKEQGRFLGMAIRSLLESVACVKLIERRNYITKEDAEALYAFSEKLFAKLMAFKKAVNK